MSAVVNTSLWMPDVGVLLWAGGVPGADTDLRQTVGGVAWGECVRRLVVAGAVAASTLEVEWYDETTSIYTYADLLAHAFILDGQFAQLIVAGSANISRIWAYR